MPASMDEPASPPRTIGVLREKGLHAGLKAWLAQPGDLVEHRVDGYHIDLVRGDLLIEVQTRNAHSLRPKLTRLLESHPVCLVLPIAGVKWIVKEPVEGEAAPARRRSPRRGRWEDVFWELTGLTPLLPHPNLSLLVVLTEQEEVQRADGAGSWRRQGRSIAERRLLGVIDQRRYDPAASLAGFLPAALEAQFTARSLAGATGVRLELARRMLYVLRRAGVIELAGRKSRTYVYSRAPHLVDVNPNLV